MNFPISPFIDLLNSLICAFCSYKLYQSYQRGDMRSPVLQYFSFGYFSLVIAYLFYSLPYFFVPESTLFLGISFIIAQAFVYGGIAYFAKVPTFFINVQWVQRVFWVVIIVSIIAIVLSIGFFTYPEYDINTGITEWNIHLVVGIASIVVIVGVLVPSIAFFFWHGFRSKDRVVKIRSIVIAIGLSLLVITAYTYYTATTQLATLVSDLFSLLSFLVIFLGIIYKREQSQQMLNK